MSQNVISLYVVEEIFSLDEFRRVLLKFGAKVAKSGPGESEREAEAVLRTREALLRRERCTVPIWLNDLSPAVMVLGVEGGRVCVRVALAAMETGGVALIAAMRESFVSFVGADPKAVLVVDVPPLPTPDWAPFVFGGEVYDGPVPFLLGVGAESSSQFPCLGEAMRQKALGGGVLAAGIDLGRWFLEDANVSRLIAEE